MVETRDRHRSGHGTGPPDLRPETSVIDADHRAWGVPNLFVADGSVCPTQGAANPALTIMALSSRLAERMASGAAMDGCPRVRRHP